MSEAEPSLYPMSPTIMGGESRTAVRGLDELDGFGIGIPEFDCLMEERLGVPRWFVQSKIAVNNRGLSYLRAGST